MFMGWGGARMLAVWTLAAELRTADLMFIVGSGV